MTYGKIENGELVIAPKNYNNIINFDQNEYYLSLCGYVPIIEEEPAPIINELIQELSFKYVEDIDETTDKVLSIHKEWIVKDKPKEQFLKDFFNTSLGYVRRKVSMQTGDTKDFLTDILPLLQVDIPILIYTEDGEQHKVMVTEDFINECKQQLLKDFYGV